MSTAINKPINHITINTTNTAQPDSGAHNCAQNSQASEFIQENTAGNALKTLAKTNTTNQSAESHAVQFFADLELDNLTPAELTTHISNINDPAKKTQVLLLQNLKQGNPETFQNLTIEYPELLQVISTLRDEWLAEHKANLPQQELKNSYLVEADLSGLEFKDISFEGSNLQKTNFAKSSFTNVTFENVNLRHAKFQNTTHTKVAFTRADLTNATFSSHTNPNSNKKISQKYSQYKPLKTVCKNIEFTNCVLNNTNFLKASITNAKFTDGQANDTNFRMTKINSAKFELTLRRADFEKAKVSDSDFLKLETAKISDKNTTFEKCNFQALKQCTFTQVQLPESNFTNARLNGVEFIQVNLDEIDFTNAKGSITLKESSLEQTNFTDADLKISTVGPTNIADIIFNEKQLEQLTFIPNHKPANQTQDQNLLENITTPTGFYLIPNGKTTESSSSKCSSEHMLERSAFATIIAAIGGIFKRTKRTNS